MKLISPLQIIVWLWVHIIVGPALSMSLINIAQNSCRLMTNNWIRGTIYRKALMFSQQIEDETNIRSDDIPAEEFPDLSSNIGNCSLANNIFACYKEDCPKVAQVLRLLSSKSIAQDRQDNFNQIISDIYWGMFRNLRMLARSCCIDYSRPPTVNESADGNHEDNYSTIKGLVAFLREFLERYQSC